MGDTAMVFIDPHDQAALDTDGLTLDGFERVIVRAVDYDRLDDEAEAVASEARELGIKFVLYSRNDQVFARRSIGPLIRRLRTGYSSFSGIDQEEAYAQARLALADLKRGHGTLILPPPVPPTVAPSSQPQGTFSLIFDTEQIGGARFGMPRILELLDRYGVRATFFVTGFIHRLYPDLVPALTARGHEIGVHGMYHEWLTGLPPDEQCDRLHDHLAEFRKHYPVAGANFIYRMNADTVHALINMGLHYCVVFAEHYYRPFAYRRPSTQPLPIWTAHGGIWLVPIPVETYSLPWFATRLLIDSALIRSQEEGAKHVSVLMHPFRDGSRRHLGQLEAMLHYVLRVRHLKPITLKEWISAPLPTQASAQIVTSVERINASHPEGARRGLWTCSELYFQRISTLYRALTVLGRHPALTLDTDGTGDTFAVYPEVPEGKAQCIHFDPLTGRREDNRGWQRLLSLLEGTRGPHVFLPPRRTDQWALLAEMSLPRHKQDLTGFLPEAIIRFASRLRKGQMLF